MATLSNSKSNTLVTGTSGADSIYNSGDLVTVNSGAGNDSIYHADGHVTIDSGDGDDKITMHGGALNKVFGGAGNDYIYDNYSNTFNSIDGGDGNDTIISFTGSVDGGDGNDVITISGPATASGGKGNDTIYGVDKGGSSSGSWNSRLYKYISGDGNDVIIGFKAIDTLRINGAITHSTIKSGTDILVSVDGGVITLKGAASLSAVNIEIKELKDLLVTGTENADTLRNYLADATINALGGNDYIYNDAANVLVNGDAGNDSIYAYGKNVTVDSGTGNDYISSGADNQYISINSGEGNDTVYNGVYGNNATINTGDGDDSVYNGYMNVACTKISLGAGNDTLRDWSYYGTLNGGAGNDLIQMEQEHIGNVIEYAVGDGNDTIIGFNPSDTLSLTGGTITGSVISGDDLILKIGTGSITFKNTGSVNVNGKIFNPSAKTGTSGHDFLTNFDDNTTINALGGSDKIANSGNNVLINTGEGNNSVGNYGDKATIVTGNGNNTILSGTYMHANIIAGTGNDSIHTGWTSSTIDAGGGNDTIVVHYASSIKAGDGDDVIRDGNDGTAEDGCSHYGSTINGGKGNDTIYAYSSWDGTTTYEYTTGDGNDVIYSYGSNDTIKIVGKYTTSTVGSDVLITVGDGSILLKNAKGTKLNIAGKEFVDTKSKSVTLTKGNDTYGNSLDGATIDALAGNDTIENFASNVSIYSAVGNNYISNRWLDSGDSLKGNNVTIKTGKGNDTIQNFSGVASVSIDGGNGQNYIYNDSPHGTLISGSGNDKFTNYQYATDSVIDMGAGNDYIQNNAARTTINAGAGNDSINNHKMYAGDAASVSINAGAGNDSIYNTDNYVTIAGGAGNDVISLASSAQNNLIKYNPGDGNDVVYGFKENSTLQIGDGTATCSTVQSGDDIIVTVGKGKVTLKGAAALSYVNIFATGQGGTVNPKIIKLTDSADTYSNTLESATIKALNGNDTIYNGLAKYSTVAFSSATVVSYGKESVSIDGGAGDDLISLYGGAHSTIYGGAGNDSILNGTTAGGVVRHGASYVTLDGGDGNDYINNEYNSNVKIDGGAGNDFIRNDLSEDVTIKAGDGDDTIYAWDVNVLLNAGKGNDSVYGWSYIYEYADGDGNDTLSGSPMAISITKGKVNSSVVSGNDLILKIGQGSITLLNGAKKNIPIVSGKYDAYWRDKKIINYTQNTILSGGNNADSIHNYASNATIQAGKGNDTILNENWNGSAWDAKTPDKVLMNGGDGNDSIVSKTSNTTLIGSKGNDTIELLDNSTNNVIVYTSGDGADVVVGFDDSSTLQIVNGTRGKASLKGDDVIIPIDKGSVTLKDANGLPLHIIDANGKESVIVVDDKIANALTYNDKKTAVTVAADFVGSIAGDDYEAKVSTIDASAVTAPIELYGNKNSNVIIAAQTESTLHGGAGNDTLIGGAILTGDAGKDLFVYSGGNVTITDYVANTDRISLDSAQIADFELDGDDVVLDFGGKSLTISEGKGKKITFSEGKKSNVLIFEDDKIFNGNKTAVMLSAPVTNFNAETCAALVTIDAAISNNAVEITGNAKNNVIVAGDKGATLGGGKGNDILYGGNGKDSLCGDAGNDKLYGGSGNDSLWGGAGNDMLYGGDGADTFFYASGDGKDCIYGFGNDDLLQITGLTGAVTGALNKKGDEFTIKVGKTAVAVFKEFTATTFNVNLNGTLHQITK